MLNRFLELIPFRRSEAPSSCASNSSSSSSETLSNSVLYSMDPTSSKAPFSSAPTSLDLTKYDVFLSFYGKDTRSKFTAHLYAALVRNGIRTFMDDPELPTGDIITDALRQAIKDSKIYVVVLSENYAYSPWCLDELVEIYDCYEKMNRLIIGVYLNIDPSVVRHQTESFKKAFEKHETNRFKDKMDKVNEWRSALTNVAAFSGKPISPQRSEADIVEEIVDVILRKINPNTLYVTKYPVGLDSRVNYITKLLSSGTEGVIKFGIYGMGGVGKTTFAKALYNQLLQESFQGSCFLANVRENSGTAKGLASLQKQLIQDVIKSKTAFDFHNVDQGTNLIEARICSIKVLVVFDDLDNEKQVESLVREFALGSVVIITTRDERILDKIEVEPRYRYMLKELDEAESLELFNLHAFGNATPDETLKVLSADILRHANGLPLALELFGSYLYEKPEVAWRFYIESLEQAPNNSIEESLKISLNALESENPMLKSIFLDVACFFIGWNRQRVVQILGTYYSSYADHTIDILKKRCLITINLNDELRMHDLLQDMGRNVARNNDPDDPGKHSRLWVSKDISHILKTHQGTQAIEGIILKFFSGWHPFEGGPLAAETFKIMSKLRFLYLCKDVDITGSFEQTFKNLRWLYWKCCPLECLPSDFRPQKLVMLELPNSKMKRLWEPHMVSQVFEKLKTLNMSHSVQLTTTPNFTILPFLETLNFQGCESLEEIHESVGILTRLVSLNLHGCVKLVSLQDSICNLRALEILNIVGCSGLVALPLKLGNMKSLKELDAKKLTVPQLPDSIGGLRKLIALRLSRNMKLETLPHTIYNLRALEVLDIDHCSRLKAFPTELGNIVSLKMLKAETLGVLELPDSIGHLSKLVHLNISGNSKLETLPDSICNLRALEVLDIDDCCNLKALPIELGKLECLTKLILIDSSVSELPDSIGRLSKLVQLELSDNANLKTLPDTICNMKSLGILNISGCTGLEKLPDKLWTITGLRKLDATCTTMLKKLPDIESSQIALSLMYLYLSESGLTALPSGLSQLSKLQYLKLEGCDDLLSIIELPPNLKSLWACGCTSMENLSNLSNLKLLEYIDLRDCSGLTEILGLEELASLKELELGGCTSSLVACTLTKRLLQIYSGFRHEIKIEFGKSEFPKWISKASDLGGSRLVLEMPPNVSHDSRCLGIILCFEFSGGVTSTCVLKNTASEMIWTRNLLILDRGSMMVIIPRSILSLTDEDDTIELTVEDDARIHGIHLMYYD